MNAYAEKAFDIEVDSTGAIAFKPRHVTTLRKNEVWTGVKPGETLQVQHTVGDRVFTFTVSSAPVESVPLFPDSPADELRTY